MAAGLIARCLCSIAPGAARRFYYWHRNQCIRRPRWFRPIAWTPVVTLRDGMRLRVSFRDVHGMNLITTGEYEPDLTDKIKETLRAGDVFVDVGANMGFFSIVASRIVGPDGLVIAIEPSRAMLPRLIANLELNGCDNVVILSHALSDHSVIAKLRMAPFYNSGVASLDDIPPAQGAPLCPVSAVPYDTLARTCNLPHKVSCIKIDTEGHDLSVLKGMRNLLTANDTIKVFCELSPQWYDVSELVAFMSELGFGGNCSRNGEWISLRDGLPDQQCNALFQRNLAESAVRSCTDTVQSSV